MAVFGTVDHNIHRGRRAAISSFFSKRAITDIEPWIHEKADQLCANFNAQQNKNGNVELRVNFLAITTDVIAAHSLNGSNPHKTIGLLQDEEKARDWQKTISALAFLTALVKQAPWLITFAKSLPIHLWMRFAPRLGRVVRLNKVDAFSGQAGAMADTRLIQDMQKSASIAIDEWESTLDKSALEDTESSQVSTMNRHNIFQTILKSSLPPQEKTPKRLGQEGFVAIAAGGETCGRMMTNALYHILANKERVMPVLAKELAEVMPTPEIQPQLKDLERMPYLVRPPSLPCSLFLLL